MGDEGNEIAEYSLEKVMSSEAGKRELLDGLKKIPRCTLKRVGGLEVISKRET